MTFKRTHYPQEPILVGECTKEYGVYGVATNDVLSIGYSPPPDAEHCNLRVQMWRKSWDVNSSIVVNRQAS